VLCRFLAVNLLLLSKKNNAQISVRDRMNSKEGKKKEIRVPDYHIHKIDICTIVRIQFDILYDYIALWHILFHNYKLAKISLCLNPSHSDFLKGFVTIHTRIWFHLIWDSRW
jgi:hypothetical protein